MLTFSRPTEFDCRYLMENLRPHDRDELDAIGHDSVEDLWAACERSYACCAVFDDGHLVCIYGVHNLAGAGVVWLLGTPLLDRKMKSLCKLARGVIEMWLHDFRVLTNLTDQRNTRIVAWLRWLGFELLPPVLINGHPFIPFHKVNPCAPR